MRLKMFRFVLILISVYLMATVFTGHAISGRSVESPVYIDLNHFHDESHDQRLYVDLDGKWVLFEKELLSPDEVRERLRHSMGEVVSVPNSFMSHMGEINSFGTYSTVVRIPKQYVGENLAVHIPYQYSAYKFMIDDIEVASNGQVGQSSATHDAEMAPRIGNFIAQSDELLLTMQVSSFDHIRGGFENSIDLGEASVVHQKFHTNMVVTLFLNGSIFIIGLFMVLFFLYRRKELEFLIFGLFAVLIAVRALFAVPFYYTLIFTDMNWLWGTRFEYMLTEATSMFYVILLWKWHEKEFSKKIMYGLVVVHLALIVTTLFTQPVFFQALFFNVFYLAVPTLIYFIYVIFRSIRNNNRNAKVNLIGLGLIFIAFFNDFALGKDWIQSVPIMLPAVAIYVVIHVVLMSKDFADSMRKTEQQNIQLRALNASNEELAERLQKEMRQKDVFLANTSHELRNPLHGILNIAQSILINQSRLLDKKTVDDLTLQLTIGHHMAQTLEDLLDITRLKEHQIQLQKASLDLEAVSVGVMEMLKVLVQNKDIRMQVNIDPNFPRVFADKNRFIQILFNLLHNAVKYTDNGSITVTANVEEDMAYVHVADTGIGIEENKLHSIFEPYEQVDASTSAQGGGFGLGLSICRQLVELHGGTLQARSVLGEGSVFTFTLPLAAAFEAESQAAATTTPSIDVDELSIKTQTIPFITKMDAMTQNRASSYIPKILAIDDDPVNLRVLENILSAAQYEIETATHAKEALEKLKWKQWDLVITDVMMPNMSGYELTRLIREQFSISELPILLLTARGHPDDIYAGFLAGANDYVTKPVDALELNARVHALTNVQVSIKERLGMEAAWLQAQIRPHFLLNTLNAIFSLSVEDMPRMMRLLDKLTQYLQSSIYLKNKDKLVPLQYEMDLLESYLYIEKERFGDRLSVKWEVEEVPGVMVPPMSIQTLVENAVNHGILKRSEGGTVTIRIRRVEDCTEISVIDDGVGMDDAKIKQIFTFQYDPSLSRTGIGLYNTEQRLKQLYGQGLQVISKPDKGTTMTFVVPNVNSPENGNSHDLFYD